MRGRLVDQSGLFSYVDPEQRIPAERPLRKIRALDLWTGKRRRSAIDGQARAPYRLSDLANLSRDDRVHL